MSSIGLDFLELSNPPHTHQVAIWRETRRRGVIRYVLRQSATCAALGGALYLFAEGVKVLWGRTPFEYAVVDDLCFPLASGCIGFVAACFLWLKNEAILRKHLDDNPGPLWLPRRPKQ